MKHTWQLTCVLISALLSVTTVTQAQTTLDANPTGCVENYDPSVDYFPEKAAFIASENVSVEYSNHYKVVTVTDAFDGADLFSYVLVQCGTPAPDASQFPDGTQFVQVPVERFIALATTQLPHLVELGRVDALVGLGEFTFVNAPSIRERIAADELVEVGGGAEINIEAVLAAEPDVVMTFGFNPDTDAHPVLIDAGVFTAMNASWREATPLGRAEWIKYTALLFNAEAAAAERYDEIAAAYEAAQQLAASVPMDERPVVLWNYLSPFSDAWAIPGGQTYAGALIEDAGGTVALGDLATDDTARLSLEVVYEGALDADVWVVNGFGINTLDDLLASDERYADFDAVQFGNVWNNNLDVNENGGNNYFELGVTNPHLILQDLVAIFHPDLTPDHEFTFFQPLTPAD
jgi:iron complex transport system substrate-binding protein